MSEPKDGELIGEEVWREIPGWEGKYLISNIGNVRSNWFGKVSRKTTYKDRDGYLRVNLYQKPRKACKLVSRLVLEVFVEPPKPNMEASHIDGNRQNNRVENLVWETRFENEQRKRIHGTIPRGERCGASVLTWVEVNSIRKERLSGVKLIVLASKYGVTPTTICGICKGKSWKTA